ncbi:MAG: type III-A CRISPR-associated RAMP protein Csm3 [Chloroflexota bacterium]
MAELRLLKHKHIAGTLTCKTGMRIGGSKEDIEIGGIDSPIIRDPVDKLPYIPGSSLKGKLRSLLEYSTGKMGRDGMPCECGQPDCMVCRVFGPHRNTNHNLGPTRIIVRDAPLSEESREKLRPLMEEGVNYAEIKRENWIDRRTGVAGRGGLRTQERVPAGAKFDFDIHVRVFQGDDEEKIVSFIKRGLELLTSEYLGGSGTRGYGWVDVEYTIRDVIPQ